MLHPRFKLDYFKRAGWEKEWIEEATRLIREEWEKHYKPKARRSVQRAADPASDLNSVSHAGTGTSKAVGSVFSTIALFLILLLLQSMQETSRAMFAQLGGSLEGDTDILDVYLKSEAQETVEDALAHWYAIYQSAGQEKAPRPVERAFARMALDFLSVPGMFLLHMLHLVSDFEPYMTASSTDAERAFSHGGLTVSKYRHSLADESVRASTLIGSWAGIEELLPPDDAIAAIQETMRKKRMNREAHGASPEPSASTSKTTAAEPAAASSQSDTTGSASRPRPRPRHKKTSAAGKGKEVAREVIELN